MRLLLFCPVDNTVFFAGDVYLNPNGPLYLLPSDSHPEGLYTSSNLLQPTSKEEIVWIIESVAATHGKDGSGRGRRIRVVGSGHSWSKVAKSDDIQLSLENHKVCVYHVSLVNTEGVIDSVEWEIFEGENFEV